MKQKQAEYDKKNVPVVERGKISENRAMDTLSTDLIVHLTTTELEKDDIYEFVRTSKQIYVALKSHWNAIVEEEFRFCPMKYLNSGLMDEDGDQKLNWEAPNNVITDYLEAKDTLYEGMYRKVLLLFQKIL